MSIIGNTSAPAIAATSNSDFRWLLIAQLYVSAALSGAAQIVTEHVGFHWLLSAFMGSAAVLWVVFDARRRNRPIGHALQMIVLGVWFVAVPIYLVVSRGALGLGWAVLHAIGLMLATCLGFYLAAYIAYG